MKTTSCILVTYFLSLACVVYGKHKTDSEATKANVEQTVKKSKKAPSAITLLHDLFMTPEDFPKAGASKDKKAERTNAIGDPFAVSDAFDEEDPWPKYSL